MITFLSKLLNLGQRINLKQKRLFEKINIILAMVLAAILGNYIALIAVQHINNNWTRFIVGIFIGLLVGILVGFSFHRGWTRFLQATAKTSSSPRSTRAV